MQAWRKVTDEGVTHFERDLPPGFVAPQFRQLTLRGKLERKRAVPEQPPADAGEEAWLRVWERVLVSNCTPC